MVYKWAYVEEAGYSNKRDLHRTSKINIKDDYFSYWETPPWLLPPYEPQIVDSSNRPDSAAWDTFNITQVVKDSLNTQRKKVNFVLKLRDETETTSRKIQYRPDYLSDSDQGYTGSKLMVVYSQATKLDFKQIVHSSIKIKVIAVYSVNGKLICRENITERSAVGRLTDRLAQGSYLFNFQTEKGMFSVMHYLK